MCLPDVDDNDFVDTGSSKQGKLAHVADAGLYACTTR